MRTRSTTRRSMTPTTSGMTSQSSPSTATVSRTSISCQISVSKPRNLTTQSNSGTLRPAISTAVCSRACSPATLSPTAFRPTYPKARRWTACTSRIPIRTTTSLACYSAHPMENPHDAPPRSASTCCRRLLREGLVLAEHGQAVLHEEAAGLVVLLVDAELGAGRDHDVLVDDGVADHRATTDPHPIEQDRVGDVGAPVDVHGG